MGLDDDEKNMVDLYTQVLSANIRGVISSFVTSVMVSRHWSTDHLDTATALTTITNTMRQMTAWMHPDHFVMFKNTPRDHHDLLHNDFWR